MASRMRRVIKMDEHVVMPSISGIASNESMG